MKRKSAFGLFAGVLRRTAFTRAFMRAFTPAFMRAFTHAFMLAFTLAFVLCGCQAALSPDIPQPPWDTLPPSVSAASDVTHAPEPDGTAGGVTAPVSAPAAAVPTPEPTPEPTPFVSEVGVELPEGEWSMILLNPWNSIEEDLDIELKGVGRKVDARIAEVVKKLIRDAKSDGVSIKCQSGFRDIEYQTGLFERKVERLMRTGLTEEEARKQAAAVVAIPGTSEHHTGLAIDFTTEGMSSLTEEFAKTKAFSWLMENGYKYGFIMRYPEDKMHITGIIYEPWHWRYVGPTVSYAMHGTGECYEEYLVRIGRLEPPVTLPETTPQPFTEN